jgi:protein TonB
VTRTTDSNTWLASIALACAMHGACVAYFASGPAHAAQSKLKELEVTMLAPEPPPPPPPPPAPVTPEPEPPKPARAPDRAKPAAPPSPARAGALLTQPETPSSEPTAEEPVRFVTDPNGHGYGSGMVARGGTADHAEQVVPVPPVPAPSAAKPGLVFADKLSRQPSLGAHDPCRGYFPQAAQSDRGAVSVIATVRDQGTVARLEIENESPAGQGFGAAARACLNKQRFEPALDDAGKRTAARTRIRINFSR